MRRLALLLLLPVVSLAVAPVLSAADDGALLGPSGELYSLKRGSYKSLFANPPAGMGSHQVLALDVVAEGKLQRHLVPGSEGPELEQGPALALDRAGRGAWLVWAGDQVLNLVGFTASGWSDVVEVSGDPNSAKSHPSLAITVDRYRRLDGAGEPLTVSRTILHLVWFDDGARERVLYTPLVIDDGALLPGNRIFDLEALAGSAEAADGPPTSLWQKPRAVGQRNGQHVALGFVPLGSGELVTVEVRSILGELGFYADQARAVIIDFGHDNVGLSRTALVEKARAVIIDFGHRLLQPPVAELLAKAFLDSVAASDPALPLGQAAETARARMLELGVALRLGAANPETTRVLEIARDTENERGTHLLELRRADMRPLPELPETEVDLYLSPHGDQASLAWSTASAVSYRESTATGWGPVRSLALGATLSGEQALALVAERLGAQ